MNPTAVIVDDDESITEVFNELLQSIGLNIVGIGFNGNDAVNLYKKLLPDIVFTDIMMPETDGFYAIEKIRELNPDAKIVAVTADLSRETDEKLNKMKVTSIIHKPFDIQDIKKLLNKIFKL